MESLQVVKSDVPELVRLLKEMKDGLDELRNKIEPLSDKVKAGQYDTSNGLSYLEIKHLMLLSYCQSIITYILLKAEGRTVSNHPVLSCFAEIRLFLEKIRPIDKKLQYQLDKLLRMAKSPLPGKKDGSELAAEKEDALKYKPNPDMLVSKIDEDTMESGGIYKPPKMFATAMVEDRDPKEARMKSRREDAALRRASKSTFIKELANELQGKPEEIMESVGTESKEMAREIERLEARARQEEELFTRVPLTKLEKQRLKHLKRSRNGLMGMVDDFDDEIAGLADIEKDKTILAQSDNAFKSDKPRKKKNASYRHFKKAKQT